MGTKMEEQLLTSEKHPTQFKLSTQLSVLYSDCTTAIKKLPYSTYYFPIGRDKLQ